MNTTTVLQDPYALKSFKYSSHDLILKMLAGEKPGQRILDAGAASGYLGRELRKRGHHLTGIEKDAGRAAQARANYDDFFPADLETYEFPQRESFDCILFADILEHLRDPQTVLRRSLRALKPDGKIIISVPNVANILIRLSLLVGKFEYTDRGIMDRGHLHFYTLKTLKKMLEDSSCRILEVAASALPVQLVLPWMDSPLLAPLHELHYLLVRSWKTLLGYQFVVKAKLRDVIPA